MLARSKMSPRARVMEAKPGMVGTSCSNENEAIHDFCIVCTYHSLLFTLLRDRSCQTTHETLTRLRLSIRALCCLDQAQVHRIEPIGVVVNQH